VRACVCACVYLCVCVYTFSPVAPHATSSHPTRIICMYVCTYTQREYEARVGRYKRFVHFNAFVNQPIIIFLRSPPPPAKPTLLQYYWTIIAQYTLLLRPSVCMLYTIQYWYWQYRVKAKARGSVWLLLGSQADTGQCGETTQILYIRIRRLF